MLEWNQVTYENSLSSVLIVDLMFINTRPG